MDRVRGVMMVVAAVVAFYSGWKGHFGIHAVLAYSLGVVALGLAVWHLTRKVVK